MTTSPVLQLEQRAGASWLAIRETRRHTAELLQKLDESLAGIVTEDDLAVVLCGSLARLEVTPGSDIDWTLLVDGRAATDHFDTARKVEQRLHEVALKDPGREGTFGSMAFSHELVHLIGGQDDTNRNTTLRVLLLLESRPLSDSLAYRNVIRNVLSRYVQEDDGFARPRTGRPLVPRFLLNDVARYWRTMCVDFAYKRRERAMKGIVLRNIKLRMSRKLLFVSGLLACLRCALESHGPASDECARCSQDHLGCVDCLQRFLENPPLDIVAHIALRLEEASAGRTVEAAKKVVDAYDRYLALLSDQTQREQLEALTTFDGPAFGEARKISHAFGAGLEDLFFRSHDELTRLTQRYGVF
jgi:predicted nucleotidyltransferase